MVIDSLRKFFLFCSGACMQILQEPECRTELPRYSMIGAFVVLTASFASLSGGYALYTGFRSLLVVIPAALLWGAFVFTLDRFVVSTIRKKIVDPNLPLTDRFFIRLGEIVMLIPRLVLAVFIAITVAVPLELRYFEPEIRARIAQEKLTDAGKVAKDAQERFPEIEKLEQEQKEIKEKENDLRSQREQLRQNTLGEVEGKEGKGLTGRAGRGPMYEDRMREFLAVEKELEKQIAKDEPRLVEIRNRLDLLQKDAARKAGETTAIKDTGDGFLARYRVLGEMADQSGPVRSLSLFLVTLFALLETIPVLMKLFAGRGPYDDLLEATEYRVYIAKQKEISDFNSDLNVSLELYEVQSQASLEIEKRMLQDTLNPQAVQHLAADKLNEARILVAEATINGWKDRQLRKGPDDRGRA